MKISVLISKLTEYRNSSNKTFKAVNKQKITKMNELSNQPEDS